MYEGVTVDSLKTGREVLEKMKGFSHLPGLILDQRVLHHLIDFATNLNGELGEQTSIMGLYKHFISTGRVSMHDPNFLGIDKDHKVYVGKDEYELSIKKSFVPKHGYVLIASDYSQLELHILAALSQDANLMNIFDLEQDPFKMIASRIKHKPVDEISQRERDSTKQV